MISAAQLKAQWKRIKTPLGALRTMLKHSEFIGADPYYRDLNDALWDMAERCAKPKPRKGKKR